MLKTLSSLTKSEKPLSPSKDDQDYWFFFFTLFFITIFLILGWVLFEVNEVLPVSVPFFDALLIALATFRLTRLFVYDRIMKFVRNIFLVRKKQKKENEISIVLREPESGPKKALWHLVNCPWCAGIWFSLVVSFFYFLTPLSWFAIFVLAVAGVATLFQIFANLLGWSAEKKKKDA